MYVLDVIRNRFYFGEVQETVIGQCTGQGISSSRTEGLCVHQWSVPEIKTIRANEVMPLKVLYYMSSILFFGIFFGNGLISGKDVWALMIS